MCPTTQWVLGTVYYTGNLSTGLVSDDGIRRIPVVLVCLDRKARLAGAILSVTLDNVLVYMDDTLHRSLLSSIN